MVDGEDTGSLPGAWLSISAAARALEITPRAVRGRIEHNTIEWRPKGNGGRGVFVPGTGSLPGAPQGGGALATLARPGPAGVPLAELTVEGERREAVERDLAGVRETLAEVRVALARVEAQLEAR